jgi:peptidoglycan hydrolase-like amidase
VLPSPVEITLVPAKSGTAAFQVRAASRPPQRLEGESLELALPPGAGGMLSSGGQAWGSLVRLWIRGEGIDAVGEIPIEAYLPGVLAKELYRHWSPAAFEAQAVAARSFAVVEAA